MPFYSPSNSGMPTSENDYRGMSNNLCCSKSPSPKC